MRAIAGPLCNLPLLFSTFLLLLPALHAASFTGKVTDPSGAAVSGAFVSAQSIPSGAVLQATTDAQGGFHFDNVEAGAYTVKVLKDGFEPWDQKVTVSSKPLLLTIPLKLKLLTESVTVSGRRSPLVNSDPNYQSLRRGKLTKVYRVNNLILQRDVGTFTFRSGSFSFLPPVLGQVAAGVFVGEGHFQLKPASAMATQHLRRIAGADQVDEDFTAMVVYFSDTTFDEIRQHSQVADESPTRHEAAFTRVKTVLERRIEPASPLSRGVNGLTQLQILLNGEDIPNYEAEILAELYNPAQRGSFRAFLHGKKDPDLRFLLNPSGAMPMLKAPEEVALLNYDPASDRDGIWYLWHRSSEVDAGTASSTEQKRLIAPQHYQIDVYIRPKDLLGRENELVATCDLRFTSVADGTRMVKFDMVPDLQVSRVVWSGKEIPFVQEDRKHDGAFYLQMPEALAKDRSYEIRFEYAGKEILESGDFVRPVPPRRIWYPIPTGTPSRATYNLKYHIPASMSIVSTGKLVSETREGGVMVSEFSSEVPISQASFRYLGEIFTKSTTEEVTHTQLSAYVFGVKGTGAKKEAAPPGPVALGPATDRESIQYLGTEGGFRIAPMGSGAPPVQSAGVLPSSPRNILIDAGNAERVFHFWFGPPSYDRLSIVQGPGQGGSLPGLIGAAPGVFTTTEGFARMVSLQWWDNTVSPASFHDQWLTNGFADFSSAIYDLTAKPALFREHWQQAREAVLQPPAPPKVTCGPNPCPPGLLLNMQRRFPVSSDIPNEVGPIWMGLLNDTNKARGIGGTLASAKGGYVLHMLRCMMWEPSSDDTDFRAMLRDYLDQFANRTVSTEDFQRIVEKHIKPVMDLDGNHTMNWFFKEWIYGTDVPTYSLEYTTAPGENGKTLLTGKLKQSGVSPQFAMPVPIFGEFAGKQVRVGVVPIRGNSTVEFKVQIPEAPTRVQLNVDYDILTRS